MYHWLADKKPSDPTKVFQIEDGAVLNMIITEHIAPWAADANLRFGNSAWGTTMGTDTTTNGYDLTCKGGDGTYNDITTQDNWAYATWTFSGASGILGAAAAIAAIAALI